MKNKTKQDEIKIKFFAQYFGQICMRENQYKKSPLCTVSTTLIDSAKDWHLELKPLSYVSDDTALEVNRIIGTIDRGDYFEEDAYLTEAISEGRTLVDNFHNGDAFAINHEVIDYLRSKGYALPYSKFSVKDLVELGWVKLI